ncbi:MAG TPA: ABC transporter permease DevC [Pseudolabrys sp.]
MNALVAWRMLTHEKGRSALAIGGILIAILLIFLQLGFYRGVPEGGLLFYNAMRFDLMLASESYVFEAQSSTFPRRRLYQALALPEIASATALYHGSGRWLNSEGGLARDVFVIGFRPGDLVFDLPEITRQLSVLRQPDTILADAGSRPEFGALVAGRQVEIEQRAVTIGGLYHLGTGFVGLGVAVTSDLNFIRMFPGQDLGEVNLGLLTIKPGADANRTAARLRAIMPADTRVFTRQELVDHETKHWVTETSTGLIFGFGAIVACVVGLVILNQTLTTQITRQLPQYATLKAIGYSDRALGRIVATLAVMMATISFIPAVLLALVIYRIVRQVTLLPIGMTAARFVAVLAIAWGMSMLSAFIALRTLRRADPAELF